jgi:Endonuclease/Exonuclease/phosphatase family
MKNHLDDEDRGNSLDFLWWNLESFAHFDIARSSYERWPGSKAEYEEKSRRVETVLERVRALNSLKLIAFGEITEQAACDLRNKLFPTYRVFSLGGLYATSDFHVAVLYSDNAGFYGEDFLQGSNVPNTTRPMAIIHLRSGRSVIRFYVCHWTARFSVHGEKWRMLTAQQLNNHAYDFLRADEQNNEDRHIVIMGDFNEEPFGNLETWLYAHRDRAASRRQRHYSDEAMKRVHLYNCAWRLLGEHLAHPQNPEERELAGSYYWRDSKTWHTYDQVIVSGSLLSGTPPYFDEGTLRVASTTGVLPNEFLAADKLPQRFNWNEGNPIGMSDHLPIVGRLVLR